MAEDIVNRRWLLARRPTGLASPDDFRLETGPVPVPGEGDILVRTLYFGYDASQRIWLTEGGGYMAPIQIGEPMRATTLGQVVRSNDPAYAVGDLVEGLMTWEDYVVVRGDGPMPLRTLPSGDYPLSWNLGVFGIAGLAAYFGVVDRLKVTAADTVVISAATGATGSIAGSICKALGARVIGIAGGADKCRWLVDEADFDAAVDYKDGDLAAHLHDLCPDGVTAYFDNVGGDMLDIVLRQMAPHGRVLISGAVSSGYTSEDVPGPKAFMQICVKQLTVYGLLLFFYGDRFGEGVAQLARWAAEGKLHIEEDVVDGFEKAPALLPTIFTGKQPGKLVLHVADPV